MSAAKETLDGASGLIGEEEEQIDETKLICLTKPMKIELPIQQNRSLEE